MPGFLRQSTASQSRVIGPFVDDSDFKTVKTALTIANTDIKLVVNGGASANKNSGGGTHRVNGVYGVTFDATDTATVGEMEVSVAVSGALVVFDKFFVVEEAVYDAFYAASALGYVDGATVNATKIGGTSQTGRDLGASVLLSSGNGTGQVSLSSGTVTVGTNNDKTGYALSTAGVQAIWDALTSALTTVGSIGKLLVTDLDAAVSSRMATFTLPTNFSSLVIDSTGRVNAFLIGIVTSVFTEGATGRIAAAFKQFFNIASPAATMDRGVLVDTVTTYTGNTPQTGDGFARLGAPAGASHAADVAAVKSDTAAAKVKTDKLTFNSANSVAANMTHINDVGITGDGVTGDVWRPA